MKAQAFIVLFVACTQGDDVPAPLIASITPDHATAGTTVTIAGSAFCQQPEMSEDPLACENLGVVEFGQVPGTIAMYTDTSISTEVPALPAGVVAVAIAVAGRRSNHVDLIVEP